MKKLALFGMSIIFLMIMSILAMAIGTPLPIIGRLFGSNVGYQLIEVTNQRTGVKMTEITIGDGQYMVEWANSGDMYSVGDTFIVKVLGCSDISPDCTQFLTWHGEAELFTTFDLTDIDVDCPSCPSTSCGSSNCPSCPTTSCPDPEDTTCPKPSSYCGEIDDICNEEVISLCSALSEEYCDEPVCDECPTVPGGLTPGETIIYAIVLLLGGTGLGVYFTKNKTLSNRGGIKIYQKLDGTTQILHKHPGLRSYHDPKQSHIKEIWEKHPSGQLYPKYEKNPIENNRWEYKG